MIRWRAVGGRERWGEWAVRGGDDQVKNVIFVVGRKVNMLSKVKGGQKRQKLRGEVISRIIKMYVKVASNDEFVRCGSSEREEWIEVVEKNRVRFGNWRWRGRTVDVIDGYFGTRKLESDGRWFERREIWKAGGSSVKGSRMRKPVLALTKPLAVLWLVFASYFAIISGLRDRHATVLGYAWTADSWSFMTCHTWRMAEPQGCRGIYPPGIGRWVIARMPGASRDAGGIAWVIGCRGHRVMPGASRESSLGCRGHLVMPGASTKQLHKKTASLRVGWIASETLEEKRKALRLYASTERFRDRCYRLASERKKLLDAEIAAEKWALTDAELVALRIRRERLDRSTAASLETWKRLHLLADFYGQLFIPEI